jgi:hypothetical protein
VNLRGHSEKKWKLLLLFLGMIVVCLVSQAFSISGPDEPPEFMIKDDWIRIMKNDPQCSPCVIFSSLKIVGKDVAQARASVMVEITGHWTGAKDCRSSACLGFSAANGISQKVQKTMNYRNTSNGWKFENYQ